MGRRAGRSVGRTGGRPFGRLGRRSGGRSVGQTVGWTVGAAVERSVTWSGGRSAAQPIDRLSGRSVGRTVGRHPPELPPGHTQCAEFGRSSDPLPTQSLATNKRARPEATDPPTAANRRRRRRTRGRRRRTWRPTGGRGRWRRGGGRAGVGVGGCGGLTFWGRSPAARDRLPQKGLLFREDSLLPVQLRVRALAKDEVTQGFPGSPATCQGPILRTTRRVKCLLNCLPPSTLKRLDAQGSRRSSPRRPNGCNVRGCVVSVQPTATCAQPTY